MSRDAHFSFASLLSICSTKGLRHIYVNLCNLVKDFLLCWGHNLLDHPRLGVSLDFASGHVIVRRRRHNGNEVSNQTSNQNTPPPPIRMHLLLQSECTTSSNQNAPPPSIIMHHLLLSERTISSNQTAPPPPIRRARSVPISVVLTYGTGWGQSRFTAMCLGTRVYSSIIYKVLYSFPYTQL